MCNLIILCLIHLTCNNLTRSWLNVSVHHISVMGSLRCNLIALLIDVVNAAADV